MRLLILFAGGVLAGGIWAGRHPRSATNVLNATQTLEFDRWLFRTVGPGLKSAAGQTLAKLTSGR